MLTKLYTYAQAYLAKEDGATAIEYGLIAAGIAIAIVGTVVIVGEDIDALFVQVSDELQGAAGGGEGGGE